MISSIEIRTRKALNFKLCEGANKLRFHISDLLKQLFFILTYWNAFALSACRFLPKQCQERQPCSFWGSEIARAKRSFSIRPESSTLLLFPVRQSPVRHGMSSGTGLGLPFCGTSAKSRRFRLQDHVRQGFSSDSGMLDFLSTDPAALRPFRNLLCSNMSRLHCQVRHGLSSLEWVSSRARFRAHIHDKHGFELSFPNNSPVTVINIREKLRRTNGQAPISYLPKERKNKLIFLKVTGFMGTLSVLVLSEISVGVRTPRFKVRFPQIAHVSTSETVDGGRKIRGFGVRGE